MTRNDLVKALAERFGQLAQRDVDYAVRAMLDAMSQALIQGHRIEIRGFGTFVMNRRPTYTGRNPRSGEQVEIPEKRLPHFKVSKLMLSQLNPELQALDFIDSEEDVKF